MSLKQANRARVSLRVLLAEDNAVNRLVLQAMLEPFGVKPVIAENGFQAVTAWRDETWDLILMDVQMPVMDGVTATRAIRDEETASGRARTPIIGVTANVMAQQLQGYLAAGMDKVVSKPIDFRLLVAAIEDVLSPTGAQASFAA
jgi:CheY-like chemotaxis protein